MVTGTCDSERHSTRRAKPVTGDIKHSNAPKCRSAGLLRVVYHAIRRAHLYLLMRDGDNLPSAYSPPITTHARRDNCYNERRNLRVNLACDITSL